DTGCVSGGTAVRRLSGFGQLRQGRRRPVLRAAVHARAVPDGGGVINTGDSSPVDQVGDDAWLDPARPVPEIRTELPGPEARVVLDRDRRITSRSLPRAYPLVPSRGTGAVLEDVDGNLFLDFNAGIAVCSTGHAHPRVVEAVRRQAGALLHYSASDFYLPIYSEMAEALAATAPMPGPVRVFLTNSGTEAV